METSMWRKWFCGMALSAAVGGAAALGAKVTDATKGREEVTMKMEGGVLRLAVMSPEVIRVTYAAGEVIPELKSYSVVENAEPAVKWLERETGDAVVVETAEVRASVDRKTGAVTFRDAAGKVLLQESAEGREISPSVQPGVQGTLVRQSFVLPAEEGIYGLGQHQQGVWNYRGHTVRLLQENREVGIPVIFSSRGYGLLWDDPAVTEVSVGAPETAPATQPARGRNAAPAGAGEDVVRWSSEVGKAIDYYFVYGGNGEGSMRAYRALTGEAPLMPEWLLGFWQCKERYRTQEEVLGAARQYRDLGVPIDGMIQDWRYWPDNMWGSHQFDKSRYPDPSAMTKQLHDMHFHILISVWPKFDVGTANFDELEKAGALFDPVIPYVYPPGRGKWYDPFSPAGRELYWKQISREIFAHGFDGWWLDAPEPELSGKWGEFRNFRTSVGPGATVFNAYPLMHSTGIYQGQRAETEDKRVVILTRSAYAGQQRNSAITWSGDIGSTWQVLRAQIPAGLNFSMSGIPYWNTDIGGFSGRMDPADPKYEELFARWFEFGSFCPMFRVHGSAPADGTGPGKEYWWFDPATQGMWRKFAELRYRLMPYTYSTAWQVTSAGAAIMRPLVMDFAQDKEVLDIGDQYLFGPSIMVNPVTAAGAKTRSVYLPGDGEWYDFWTGKAEKGHQRIEAAAPVESMPLYVRAGSIVPMGPAEQYVGEKTDPVELRVYRGADGAFTLYEDEGDSYRYEKGVRATIPMQWNEKAGTLTIGKRAGEFPGMLKERTFDVVFVDEGHGDGVGASARVDKVVKYSGEAVTVAEVMRQ
jgi:alpha-D-xyloside xylohydrolase